MAATIGKGTVDPSFVDHYVIFGALMGALAWNIITWYYGIPSSSSHALVGGLVGATMAKAGGVAPIVWGGFGKILAFIIISPLVGFLIGGMLMVLVAWVFRDRTPHQAERLVPQRCNWCRRRPTASAMAATMRRRPSASSGCC